MGSVLIVSNTNTTMSIVSGLLSSQPFSRIVAAQSGSEARRCVLENEYDLIIIDTPLSDELGDDFALHAAENSASGVILIVENNTIDEVNINVENSDVFVVPKPISPDFFYQAVKLLQTSRKRLSLLEDENRKLRQKIDELRLVNRAKLVLMQMLKMNEDQAHRYIEKQSMNLRQTRTMVAENILRTYEN